MNKSKKLDNQHTVRATQGNTTKVKNNRTIKSKFDSSGRDKDYYKLLQDIYTENGFNQDNFKDKIQREIERIEQKIFQDKKEAIQNKKLYINSNMDLKNTKKKKQKIIRPHQEQKKNNSKSQTILSSFFDRNTQKIIQILMIKILSEEDQNNKDIKKKIDEYKIFEKTVLNHNNFIMFLLNKKINYIRESTSTHSELAQKFHFLVNKLENYLNRSDIKEEIQNSKNMSIQNFLNQELFQNYVKVKEIQQKHNIKIPDIIYKAN